MALEAGAQLGPYRVQGQLGVGGMGEVYRALDPRLGREVAVKILPVRFASDPERLQRFEQEARAAGALNHPNILAVHDFGSHDGAPFVIFELLEGETLRQRLGGSPLPVRKALDYSGQIARGLAAAHERGIVHRDLKPENLFITRDGRVKILDFGLAKLTGAETGPHEVTRTQTMALATEPGKLLGTVGYMSPEQVRAQPADHRSDIFTLGAILYEMLSGQRAFRGESAVETMNSILKEDPPELSATNRNLPPELERIVRHCLEKNPDERFQSARDLAFDIDSMSEPSSTLTGMVAPISGRRRRWAAPLLAVGALAIVAAGAFLAGRGMGRAAASAGEAAAAGTAGAAAARSGAGTMPTYTRLTFRRGVIRTGRFTPDGRSAVYAAEWGADPVAIYTTSVGSAESRLLGFRGADLLSVSSRGELAVSLNVRFLGGFIKGGTLARVPLTGEAPREVLDGVSEADWSPDGEKLAVLRDVNGRFRLEMPIDTVLYETAGWISNLCISPDGDRIAFIDHPLRADDGGSVFVIDPGKPPRAISPGWLSAVGLGWSPDGREVWFTATKSGVSRSMWAVSLEGKQRTLASAPGTLTLQDVSHDGNVLVTREDARMGINGLARGEAQERDLSWLDWSLARDLSPDGKTLLFDESGEGGGTTYTVFVRKTDGSPAVRLAEGAGYALSPDGRWALIRKAGESQGIELVPTGTGSPRPVPVPGLEVHAGRFFPDGQRLLLAANEEGGPIRAYVGPIAVGAFRPLAPESIDMRGGAISPDGGTIALSDSSGRLLLCPADGSPARPVSGLETNVSAVGWSSDGRWIYVRIRGENPVRLQRFDWRAGRLELVKVIKPADNSGVTRPGVIVLTQDATSYAYSYLQSTSDLYLVQGVR